LWLLLHLRAGRRQIPPCGDAVGVFLRLNDLLCLRCTCPLRAKLQAAISVSWICARSETVATAACIIASIKAVFCVDYFNVEIVLLATNAAAVEVIYERRRKLNRAIE